jgi:hypothetical protein
MNTFTVVTGEAQAPEVTQAKERIFIHDLPVTYTTALSPSIEALYQNPAPYGKRHYITLGDIKELVVSDSEISPNRSLNDQEMIMYLTNELYEASKEADVYRERAVRIIADLEKIVEALRDEAQDREWCDEYNQFCTNLNVELSEPHLLLLEQEFEVEVEVVANVTTRVTVSVMARSYEDAQDMVLEDPRMFFDPSEQALEEAQNSGFDDYDVNFV